MPVKNYHPAYLDEAVRSMADQTDERWRLLIIAEPADIPLFRDRLHAWLDDDRVTLCANEGNRLAGAFNTGMRRAATEFVAILLADDAWAPDAVATLCRNIAAHPDA